MGWLPADRIFDPHQHQYESSAIDLVSLGHREIRGYLAVKVAGLYVEFRTTDGWDRALPRAAVLIHQVMPSGVSSLIIASNKAVFNNEWQPGQVYGPPASLVAFTGGTRIAIESFDLAAKKARVRVQQIAGVIHQDGPGQVFGGVQAGGEGWILTPSGKLKRVPPHSPLIAVLDRVGEIVEMEEALVSAVQHLAPALSVVPVRTRG
jgi:hypothetical protein